jgi:hypothetical protein
MDQKTVAPLVVTVFVALMGYVATYLNSVRLSQRKDRLERIDRQLREFYGPLYSLTETAQRSWIAFRHQINRPSGSFWNATPPPNEAEKASWRLWMRHVLMPLNLRIESVLIEHTDLLEGPEMPGCFLDLMAHIAAYKAVLKAWEDRDYSLHLSVIDYPTEANSYIKSSYLELKTRQQKLIGNRVSADG